MRETRKCLIFKIEQKSKEWKKNKMWYWKKDPTHARTNDSEKFRIKDRRFQSTKQTFQRDDDTTRTKDGTTNDEKQLGIGKGSVVGATSQMIRHVVEFGSAPKVVVANDPNTTRTRTQLRKRKNSREAEQE